MLPYIVRRCYHEGSPGNSPPTPRALPKVPPGYVLEIKLTGLFK